MANETTEPTWQPPSLEFRWGAYDKPDGEEQAQIVQAVGGMLGENKRVLTTKMALQKLRQAGIIEFESLEAVTEALDKEQAAADQRAEENAKNQLANAAAVEVDTEAKRARFASKKPPGAKP